MARYWYKMLKNWSKTMDNPMCKQPCPSFEIRPLGAKSIVLHVIL
jgi:hypothetical protein